MTDEARITLADGTTLAQWSEYSIDSHFLTPCDGWNFTWNDIFRLDEGAFGKEPVRKLLVPDRIVQIWIGDTLQCTGWIDRVSYRSDPGSGTVVNVQGRDMVRPLIKAGAHPDFRVKGRTVQELIEKVVDTYYLQNVPTIVYDNASNVQVLTGSTTKRSGKKRKHLNSEIDYCQAHPGESAFDFLARNLRRHGLWMWAAGDGTLVVSGPTYSGPVAAKIARKPKQPTIIATSAEYTWDRTSLTKFVFVRGKSTSKEFNKTSVSAFAQDPNATQDDVLEVVYMQHDQAQTADQCKAYALQEMSKRKESERVYRCTCVGHRNPVTDLVYAVDTLVQVDDDYCGVHETMWCVQRTFKRSAANGSTTELELLPLGSIIFSDEDMPA